MLRAYSRLTIAAAVIAMIGSGCAQLINTNAQFVDYASAEQGATVTVAGTMGNRDPNTLINGVTDSAMWTKGEGWEYRWERTFSRRSYSNSAFQDNIERGAGWIDIRFPEPKRINRVVIHALNSDAQPFTAYEEAALQIQETGDPMQQWKTIGRITDRNVTVVGKGTSRAAPATTFRFDMIEADAVRFAVYEMSDATKVSERASYNESVQANTMRLIEIEVSGNEAIDPLTEEPTLVAGNQQISSLMMNDLSSSFGGEAAMEGATSPGQPQSMDAPNAPMGPKVGPGDAAPDFTVVGLDGKTITLSDYKGRVVLLNFWATWCPPCAREVPALVEVRNELGPRGFEVIGLSIDNMGQRVVREFAEKHGVNYPIAIADAGLRVKYGGIPAIPTSFLIGADGTIIEKAVGAPPNQEKALFRRLALKGLDAQ